MKLSLIATASLVATTSALPIRIITFHEPSFNEESIPVNKIKTFPFPFGFPIESTNEKHHHDHSPPFHRIIKHPIDKSSFFEPGPLSALLSRLGIFKNNYHNHDEVKGYNPYDRTSPHPPYHNPNEIIPELPIEITYSGDKDEDFGPIRILPFIETDHHFGHPNMIEHDAFKNGEMEYHRHGHGHGHHFHGYGNGHDHHGYHHHKHWHHHSTFIQRLHKALLHLSPPEALALAFVLGAGLGSIIHLFFMLSLLTIRHIKRSRAVKAMKLAKLQRRKELREMMNASCSSSGQQDSIEKEPFIAVCPAAMQEEVLPQYVEGEVENVHIEEKV